MRPFASVRADLAKFAKKLYRDGFLQSQTRSGIALQIRALREKLGLSQEQFAAKTGKKQSVISRLESPDYGKASVQTLLDIASAVDVALVVKFVSYPEFLAQTADMSPVALQPDTIFESLGRVTEWQDSATVYQGDWFRQIGQDAPPGAILGQPLPAQLVPFAVDPQSSGHAKQFREILH
jgi:transcriptional regulator with XRE-family HTH domain